MAEPVGVLLMAYGTPASLDEVESYYTHIRRGRPPSPDQLADLRRRYQAIGGVSPLTERTTAQAHALQAALGEGFLIELGNKHAPPFIEDAMARLLERGVRGVVGLVLAPHYSTMSVGEYGARAEAVAPLTMIESWHLEPELIALLADRVSAAVGRLPEGVATEVLFTAHSLPTRVLDTDDPYPRQVEETAAAVAIRAGAPRWRVAWQSAGRTGEAWLGPDVLEVLPEVAAEGADAVVVCPVGFVSDHLEVLYDIDVDARAAAGEHGLRLERTESLNDDPRLIAVLAGVVRREAAAA